MRRLNQARGGRGTPAILRRAYRRLALPAGRRSSPAGDDHGAIAALVAIVLGMGVLLGMAAMVIDVARLYVEREELQSGADAAAWAVAEGCARLPDTCADQLAVAERYAAANASDGASAVTLICGRGPSLADCPASGGGRSDCLGTPPDVVNYAEVHTRTLLTDGRTLLPPTFAGALSGDYAGTEVPACSRVAWGPPRRATGLAVTFSTCEFNALTDNGTSFWPPPSQELPPDSAEEIIFLKGAKTLTCDAGPSGWDRPGGFGWLDDLDASCTTTVEADGTFGASTGNSVSKPCKTVLPELLAEREPTLIPIYDGVRQNGSNITYHLAGFASFVLTGYHLGESSQASWLTGDQHCNGNERCMYGYFTRGLVPTTGAEIGGPDLGVAILNLVG